MNSIEILQNTLLQLIVRQGTDSTRQNVVLKSGELGYTTDTKKLYVGDGTTFGGSLIGKTYAGSATNITTLSPASEGDLAYDTDNRKLYRLKTNDGSNIGDWEQIGGVYIPLNDTINIGNSNRVSVGTISGSNVSPNALSNPIHLNGSNQLALSARTTLDEIVPRTGDSIKFPNKIQIGSNTFEFANDSYSNGDVFYIANDGRVKTGSVININTFNGTNTFTGVVELSGGYKLGRRTVAQLPSAVGNEGLRFEVIDADSPSLGAIVSGDDGSIVTVRSDGTDWIVVEIIFLN
jgi:hypothetical protein